MEKSIYRVSRVIPQGPSSQVQKKQQVIGSEGYEKTTPFLFLSEDWFAPYKYPRWIEFLPELPKTATGKIQRFKLRG
jgi:acyl-coenzyme A synthetase/AMP-(fatty) acid ligase